ncbi:MAG: ABC transporter substrate-binding protein [Vulcanimicrobiaceae bacterium]
MLRTLCAAIAIALLCTSGTLAADPAPKSVTIVYQYGLAYAPLLIIKQEHWIEKDFPQTTVTWNTLTSGAVVRDGLIAGTIQVGILGASPFLIAWDHGAPIKLIANTSDMDMWLCTKDPNVHSLKDFKPGMQIGMPAPDSADAIALRKEAENQLGNAHALDSNFVAISHPNGLAALETGQLTAHMTSPPFEFEEVERGAHVIFDSSSAFGRITFTAAAMPTSFYDAYPDFAAKFLGYIQRAIKLIKSDPEKASHEVAEASGKPELASQYKAWMTRKAVFYDAQPAGFMKTASFMKKIGIIDRVPVNIQEIELPPLQKLRGN